MPSYDYYCEENGLTVEVKHGMNEKLSNWGELCENAGLETGNTPLDSPVKKLITGSNVVRSSVLSNPEPPPCASGCSNAGSCSI